MNSLKHKTILPFSRLSLIVAVFYLSTAMFFPLQIDAKMTDRHYLVGPEHETYLAMEEFFDKHKEDSLEQKKLFARHLLNLVSAGHYLEQTGIDMTRNFANYPVNHIRDYIEVTATIMEHLKKRGINFYRLLDILDNLMQQPGVIPGKTSLPIRQPDEKPLHRERTDRLFFQNTFFFNADSGDNMDASDLFQATMEGENHDNSVSYRLVLQNKNNNRHYTHLQSPDFEEMIGEARLTMKIPHWPISQLDMGRYYEEHLLGGLYSGYTDGIRGQFKRSRYSILGAIENSAKRFEQNGFGKMQTSTLDTFRVEGGIDINHGKIKISSFYADLEDVASGAANVTGIRTGNYKTPVSVRAGDFTSLAISGEKLWSGYIYARGFIEQQDLEGYNPSGKMGRNFEGLQFGLDVTYDRPGDVKLFSSLRLREIDHIQLGLADNLYTSEFLRSGQQTSNFLGNRVNENFNNSEYFCFGAERQYKLSNMSRPIDLRLYWESLSGWKDLDTRLAGMQDNVYDQQALGLIAEYRTPGEWTYIARLRGVAYEEGDFDYIRDETFLKGFAPENRFEFDFRLVSPTF